MCCKFITHPQVDIHQLRCELLLATNGLEKGEGEHSLRRAIESARSQRTKPMELTAAMRLARLLAWQGRGDEVRMMLGEIYNWFTEGFDTADLREAKASLTN